MKNETKLFVPEKYVRGGLILITTDNGEVGAVVDKADLNTHLRGGLIDHQVVWDMALKEVV